MIPLFILTTIVIRAGGIGIQNNRKRKRKFIVEQLFFYVIYIILCNLFIFIDVIKMVIVNQREYNDK